MGLTGRPTGSPTAEGLNTGNYSKVRHKAVRWNPFKDVLLDRGAIVERIFQPQRWIEGYALRWMDDGKGGEVQRLVWTVLDCVTEVKGRGKPGKRIHKQPSTIRHEGGYARVPSFATKALSRLCATKAKAEKEKVPSLDEDGCKRISVRHHLTRFGYCSKNEHTVDPEAFEKPSGPKVKRSKPKGKGAEKDGIVDRDPAKWRVKSVRLFGPKRVKMKTARFAVTNGEYVRTITYHKIYNEAQAYAMLEKCEGITR